MMGIEEDNRNPGNMCLDNLPVPLHAPSSVSYNRIGGVRHGFNTSSNRLHTYSPMSNSAPHPYQLAPIRPVTSGPGLNRFTEEDRIPTPPQTLNWEMSGITSSPMEQDHVYVNCCRDTGYILPDQRLVPDVEFARGGYNIAPYSPKITISDLLNPGPPSASPWQDGDRFSGTNNTHANIDEAGRATTICSTSSESISSSATLVPALSVAENHVFLVGDLYYTCRDAANSYISTLGPIHRHSSYCHRHHPYSPASCPGQHARLGRSPSLMDNISAICTHMWRKARRDVLAPRRAEAEAVRDMRDLYAWGETVSRAFQSDGLEENRMDWENAEGRRCSGVGSDVWARVGEAAKNLCKWLENNEALVSCEEAANGLRELKKEAGRSSPDEFGCIL